MSADKKDPGKKILYIDMDKVLVDFTSAFAHFSKDELAPYEVHSDDMPGAVAAFQSLAAVYDTSILATAP